MVKYLPEFEFFYYFLENRNFISKIRRSKVTDYAALSPSWVSLIYQVAKFNLHNFNV